jgi:hypothetical protein
MRLFNLFSEWRSAAPEITEIERAGGDSVYQQEQDERAERAAAIPYRHEAVKAALRIASTVAQPAYDDSTSPLEIIAARTIMHPQEGRGPRVYWKQHIEAYLGEGFATWSSISWAQMRKTYRVIPRVVGRKWLEARAREGTADDVSAKKSTRDGPSIMFAYYERSKDVRRVVSGEETDEWWKGHQKVFNRVTLFARRRPPQLPELSGIDAPNIQFAVLMDDGIGERESRTPSVAGFYETKILAYEKERLRLCLLGEVEGDAAETLSFRRIIVDGQKLALTRGNLTLAVNYAEALANQIFEGESYDPAAAMMRARQKLGASTPGRNTVVEP